MPFSRYQIRNEFSLADPELYKSADKDDPEALLEGVAMAGLVGVLRQLGDLAEFAAEIFHGLHEEVMVTAARGHALLGRVQQLESDFPSIERAFLSQTTHSAFFSSSGIGWHPNLKMEQNLITKGDLPRFVMDSYEECRGPPRLFLLDKFDVAGAGACLKRYTDPSFYKVEASSYEMSSAEAQRNKKIRKTKKGSRWKNGETPEVFQPSHVKLHQLLLEERVQNGTSESARRVKLKKRQIKLPFDTKSGKGYMEQLISSPPEDKLVHEVPVSLPTISSSGPALPTPDLSTIDSPSPTQNGSPHESPTMDNLPDKLVHEVPVSSPTISSGGPALPTLDLSTISSPTISSNGPVESPLHEYPTLEDKTVSVDNLPENVPGRPFPAEVEEKHISVDEDCKADDYRSDDVASEAENFLDALASMESEIDTEAELKQETDSEENIEKLQSNFSDSRSASDDERGSIRKKLTSFSYSDTASSHGIESPRAFASTEIPFRPRVSPNTFSLNSIDQGANFKENTSKESDSSEMSPNNGVDVNSPKQTEEIEILPEDILAPTSDLDESMRNPQCEVDNEDHNSNSNPVMEKFDICDPDVKSETSSLAQGQLTDDLLEGKSDPEEAELNDRETVSVDSESKLTTAAVCNCADDRNIDDNFSTFEDEKEAEPEPVNCETKTMPAVVSVSDHVDSNESKSLSTYEDPKVEGREIESVEKNEDKYNSNPGSELVQSSKESVETMEWSEQSVISPELNSVPSAYYDPSNMQFLDSIRNSSLEISGNVIEDDVDNPFEDKELTESSEQYDHSNMPSPETSGNMIEKDVDNPSTNIKILLVESVSVIEKTDQNGLQSDVDFLPGNDVPNNQSNARLPDSPPNDASDDDVESESPSQVGRVGPGQPAQSLQLETVDSRNHVDILSEPSPVNHEQPYKPTPEFQDSGESMPELSQMINHINFSNQGEYPPPTPFSGFNMLPQLAPINLEEMPPLPPLPPMQWRMGSLQSSSLISRPDDGQHIIDHHFLPAFPQIVSHPSLDRIENAKNNISQDDHQDTERSPESSSHTEEDSNLVTNADEQIVPKPPFYPEKSRDVSTPEREIIRPSSTSSLPLVDDERLNGIRPMKIQRSRTPLIDAVAAHDKTKLRKVSERAMPPTPKEEERDTLLEQIRAKSFNLKPAVQTRPSTQGPSTNLRVAAILEKANAIRHAFAGSDDDDDEDDDDAWSDS